MPPASCQVPRSQRWMALTKVGKPPCLGKQSHEVFGAKIQSKLTINPTNIAQIARTYISAYNTQFLKIDSTCRFKQTRQRRVMACSVELTAASMTIIRPANESVRPADKYQALRMREVGLAGIYYQHDWACITGKDGHRAMNKPRAKPKCSALVYVQRLPKWAQLRMNIM